uniref:AP complex subunit sigma n=2 Tax=Lygus hesperus TaxID=30085 RepID=A0A0A9YKA6_LYGHE
MEVIQIVSECDRKSCNIIEFRDYKLIYKRYASLYFSFCVSVSDNELMYLEIIHLFVELLDRYFESICELDLVFNFHKIFIIIDEMFLAGEIQETSKRTIISRLEEMERVKR